VGGFRRGDRYGIKIVPFEGRLEIDLDGVDTVGFGDCLCSLLVVVDDHCDVRAVVLVVKTNMEFADGPDGDDDRSNLGDGH